MSDVAVEQTPAESSAAEPKTLEIPKGGQEYAEWRMKGTPQQSKEESTPSSEKPASEAGKQERKGRSNADSRLNELLNDIREAGISPAELKSFKQNYQKVQAQAQPQEQKQQPQATTEKTEKPAAAERNEPQPPKRPRLDDWTGTMGEYEAAMDAYFNELYDYRDAAREQKQREKAAAASMAEKMQDANTRYGESAVPTISSTARAIAGDQAIHPSVKSIIDQSPVMVDLLFTMGSDQQAFTDLIELARTDPGAAIRKVVVMEQLVEKELKGSKVAAQEAGPAGPSRSEDGKFKAAESEAPPIPEKKPSRAPAPPAEVSGRGTTPADPQQQAIKTSDFAAFRAAGNRRDIDRKKGR
jgi:hypothetical protein